MIMHISEKKFKISPNPANETISIELTGKTDFPIEIDIYDVSGRHLKTTRVNSNENEINISTFTKDMYFVIITIDGEIITEKFIKK
ncbi:MAG: hypothetical protein DRJ05_01755 [Bacteroidetes bacterium]|nr:MAG: hypothetical protein DRJ05_01755 [Bacteroidota bacterium]